MMLLRQRSVVAPEQGRVHDPTPTEDEIRDPAFHPRADERFADLAVVTCHWNFAGYNRPVLNLLRFLREMDYQGIPVYGVELYMAGTDPLMERNPRWHCFEIGDENILWQKESVLNWIARQVPPHIGCIAAIDADVHFENPNWAKHSVAALERTPVIQPFSVAVWGGENGRPEMTRTCAAQHGLTKEWKTHPGFAWAFRREFFEEVGFYPWAVTGAGDTATATGVLGIEMFSATELAIGHLNIASGIYRKWAEKAARFMGRNRAGWIDGCVWHEWHGSRQDRRYLHRHHIMRSIDAARHVGEEGNGILVWTKEAPKEIREQVREYFHSRREDG